MGTSRYCERLNADFWAEPLNASTNLAFILAALLAWQLWRRGKAPDWPVAALIAVVLLIGIGSFLFHTMPAPWSRRADVIPIRLFAFGYFAFAVWRFIGLRLIGTALATALFFAAFYVVTGPAEALLPSAVRGATAGYATYLVALVAIAALLAGKDSRTAMRLAAAGAVFVLALVFRSIDQAVCSTFPYGTHFLWHLLNAVVLYLLLRAAMLARSL
jgi:hypothetical protein